RSEKYLRQRALHQFDWHRRRGRRCLVYAILTGAPVKVFCTIALALSLLLPLSANAQLAATHAGTTPTGGGGGGAVAFDAKSAIGGVNFASGTSGSTSS